MPHAMDESKDASQPINMASCLNDSDTHLDLDRSDQRNLIRLIALMQAGWTLSRGHGPRHHPRCLWCHGDLSDRTEILIHDKCWTRPRWPEQERYPEPPHPPSQHDFQLPKNINISAHIRIVLYNPASVTKARQYSKTLMFITREEMAKLALFGRNKIIFDAIDNVKTEWETVFTRWVLINWKDNNEYRASPLMAHQETELLEMLAAKGLGSPVTGEAAQQLEERICTQGRLPGPGTGYPILQDISAKILEGGAVGRGGLATAVAAFKPDNEDDDIKEMMSGGKEEALKILRAEREKEKGSVQHMDRITAGVPGLFRAFCMVMDDKSDGSHGSDEEPDEDEDYPEDEDYVEEDGEDLDSEPGIPGTVTVAPPNLPAISNPEDSDPEPSV
ncbi:hypothetical protein EDD36DRAFT_413850 [Exophiala viscosa]|uniref:Uncharacterized protein n=1 Tax=Exophiala viscosa TaxID=2486360 RepID=A0AAN6IK35_9EURO|nr:hypothetical protein EDD36DRAFT_413850 [Exophiala viscosa]